MTKNNAKIQELINYVVDAIAKQDILNHWLSYGRTSSLVTLYNIKQWIEQEIANIENDIEYFDRDDNSTWPKEMSHHINGMKQVLERIDKEISEVSAEEQAFPEELENDNE